MLEADFFDVLHVDVAGAVHLGHHFGCLLDDKGLGEQVEVHDDHFVPGDGHRFRHGRAADEAARHVVGAGRNAGQVEVAVEVGHGTEGGAFHKSAGADEIRRFGRR